MKTPTLLAGGLSAQNLQRWTALLGSAAPWRALQRRFDTCAPRERLLLIGASAAVVLMLADQLWLGPALKQFRAARQQLAETRHALDTLAQDVQAQVSRHAANTRSQQGELASWRQRVRDSDAALRRHEDSLVGPDRMLELLDQWLSRHGPVRVRAMQSLGRSDLLAPGSANANANASAPAKPAAPADPANPPLPSLYRHGVELVLEGGYPDLLQTLKALEALPQHVLWGSVSLRVDQHPRSVLTLRVYTISRDRHWLEI